MYEYRTVSITTVIHYDIMTSLRVLWCTRTTIWIILIFIIFRENQYKKNLETVIQYEEEKNNLRDNLDDLIDEHEILKEEYADLSGQLVDRDSTILAYADEIKQLLRSKGELSQHIKKACGTSWIRNKP